MTKETTCPVCGGQGQIYDSGRLARCVDLKTKCFLGKANVPIDKWKRLRLSPTPKPLKRYEMVTDSYLDSSMQEKEFGNFVIYQPWMEGKYD
jgi:hypothetical protein